MQEKPISSPILPITLLLHSAIMSCIHKEAKTCNGYPWHHKPHLDHSYGPCPFWYVSHNDGLILKFKKKKPVFSMRMVFTQLIPSSWEYGVTVWLQARCVLFSPQGPLTILHQLCSVVTYLCSHVWPLGLLSSGSIFICLELTLDSLHRGLSLSPTHLPAPYLV